MAHEITVNVAPAVEQITISGYPLGIVIGDAVANSPYVVAEPSNNVSVITSGIDVVNINSYEDVGASVINVGSQINVTLGTLFESPMQSELDGFKLCLPNFVDANLSSLSYGDVVYLESNISSGANEWKANCKLANVDDVYSGAFNALFVFISHNNNNLIILSKGYFDLEESNITQWTAGRTLYLNEISKFDITPTSGTGGWVRSLGYCLPNTINSKRIWFEPDSTYIKIN